MKVLVIGAAGFSGDYLVRFFREHNHEVIGTSRDKEGWQTLDISDEQRVKEILEAITPDAVCIPAAESNMDLCEEQPEETDKVNVLGVQYIAEWCKEHNKILVFFSTDAVYSGEDGPQIEEATKNPTSRYGKQKDAAEEIVKKVKKHVIVRPSSIYGWDNRRMNFVARLIDWSHEKKEFKAPIDQSYTPTYVVDIAKVVVHVVEHEQWGLYNVTGPESMSRYDLARKTAEVFDLDTSLIIPVKTAELGQKAPRLRDGGLVNKKVEEVTGIKMSSVHEGLRDMKEKEEFYSTKV